MLWRACKIMNDRIKDAIGCSMLQFIKSRPRAPKTRAMDSETQERTPKIALLFALRTKRSLQP